jgi:hypothetical protein
MKAETKKEVTPINATFDDLVAMEAGGSEADGFWWSVDGEVLAIYQQNNGERPQAEITIPIKTARKMANWLTTAQTQRDSGQL